MMTTYECCKGKNFPNSYYICTVCFKVYHKSCVLKNKSKYTFSDGFKIKCCENLELNSSQSFLHEKTIMEETIQELTENSQVHENYWRKIKADHEKFLVEATEREQELNDFIIIQDEQIKKSAIEIKKLHDLISDLTNKTWNTRSTQTDRSRHSKQGKEIGIQTDKPANYFGFGSKPKCSLTSEHSPKKSAAETSVCLRSRVLLVAGYHGKNLASSLINIMGRNTITSIIKPNANNKEIIDSAVISSMDFSKKDVVVLWPSNVNVSQYKDLNLRLQHTNFIVLSSPYRYDILEQNEKTYHVNLALNRLVHITTGSLKQVINVNAILRKSNYCPDGNRINNSGKMYIARHIVQRVEQLIGNRTTMNQDCTLETGCKVESTFETLGDDEQLQGTSFETEGRNKMLNEVNGVFLCPRLTQVDIRT